MGEFMLKCLCLPAVILLQLHCVNQAVMRLLVRPVAVGYQARVNSLFEGENMQIITGILLASLLSAPILFTGAAQAQVPERTSALPARPDGRALAVNEQASARFNQGKLAQEEKDFEAALLEFSEAIKLAPTYAQAYYERGRTFLILDQHERALTDFNKVIELKDPETLVDAYNNRGYIYNEFLKKYPEAIADFTRAIQIDPSYIRAYYNRALAYDRSNQSKEALADYSKTIQLDAQYVDAYNNRGIVYLQTKQFELALADFNKAVALNPKYALGYYNLGLTYATQKKFDEALDHYSRAIQINPEYAQAYHNRGYIYNDIRKDYAKALADFNKAIELRPGYLNAFYNRGLTHYNQRKYEGAVADFAEVLKLSPKDIDAFYYRGESYYHLHEYDKSIEDFQQVVALAPNDAWGHYWLARAYSLKKDLTQSLASLETAIKLKPEFKNTAPLEADLVFLRNLPEFKKLVQ